MITAQDVLTMGTDRTWAEAINTCVGKKSSAKIRRTLVETATELNACSEVKDEIAT